MYHRFRASVSVTNTQIPSPAGLPTTVTPACSKCGTIKKTRERSCCARGGAWFNNCGAPGQANVDHTWTEGLLSCRGSASSFSGAAQELLVLNATGDQHVAPQETLRYAGDANGVANVVAADCTGCGKPSTNALAFHILFIALCIQLKLSARQGCGA